MKSSFPSPRSCEDYLLLLLCTKSTIMLHSPASSLFYRTTMIFEYIILFILVLPTSNVFVFAFTSNDTDRHALLSFKDSIIIDPLAALASWNNSIHFCKWKGITCSRRRQRVTTLNLSYQKLVGNLSPHIGNLSHLRVFYLYQNNFLGPIPNEIGRLFRLNYLDLGYNSFQGGFPSNLSHCVDMRNISIYSNNLEGKLPTEFASWPNLYSFALGRNHFTGSIPPSIGNISSLHFLYLENNNLVGGIPLEVANLANLEFFDLGFNNLSGEVPQPLYNMSSLSVVGLLYNELKGRLPSNLGNTLPNLQNFYIGRNKFSGPLPLSIANASNLVIFDISFNSITGPIPTNLGSLANIQRLYLGFNPLGDNQRPDDLSFFKSLVNCTHLKILAFQNSGLRGEFPNSIVNLSTNMEILNLSGNHIYGSIPQEIGKLVNMTLLDLQDNSLTGVIPESIGELSKLGVLNYAGNNISGVIPTSISNITHLVELYLENNMLQGSIPTGLFNIFTLQKLSLTNNTLEGVIPEEILFSSEFVYLYLARNLLRGPLPSNIGSLKQLVHLDVSYNKFTGDIPASLGDCVMLKQLVMEGNLFEGKIPISFKALKSLEVLDISNNNISGSIPSFFDGLDLIEFLDLSHNKLEGEVPTKGLFSNLSAFSVVGNLQLCGGIQALHLPACHVQTSSISLKIMLVLVLLPPAILLACVALIYIKQKKSKQLNVTAAPVLVETQHPRVSYQDLLLATKEFSPDNLLGEGRYGSVYKGVLQPQDQTVAVKVLNVEVHGANKSFLAECKTLGNIRHRNLIKIITTCWSTDFKGNEFMALVLEFMTNGSLDSWLHPSSSYQWNERKLTLLQRINISIDVALGIDYLHHHSHTSIIHCDIKPSNVLLDEEFVARVGDFGLARFSFSRNDINQAHMSSTGVRGTVGYVPPEYGMGGESSAEGDVYSYGILLLEMFSGKRPTCSSILIENGNNLHDYVRKALPERVMAISDPWIVLDKEDCGLTAIKSYSRASMEQHLTSIFEVGILCSKENPRERINISVAIKHLVLVRDKLLQCKQ